MRNQFHKTATQLLCASLIIVSNCGGFAQQARSQSDPSQSDTTLPNPNEVLPADPSQSDTTLPNPNEVLPADPSQSDTTLPTSNEILPSTPGDGPARSPVVAGNPTQVIEQVETYQSLPYSTYFGLNFYGGLTSADQIAQTLEKLGKKTGTNPALIYVISTSKGLKLVLVLPNNAPSLSSSNFPVPSLDGRLASIQPQFKLAQENKSPTPSTKVLTYLVPEAKPELVRRSARNFRKQVSDPGKTQGTSYQAPATELYRWIVAPLKAELDANKIDTLVFSLDRGFRSLPIAALYDGDRFLVEQYNLALIPSFSLTDTRFQPIRGTKMLGMGISQSAGGLPALPAVSVEVPTLTEKIWEGAGYLDQQVTLSQFQSLAKREQFSIVHLATHAEFNPGNVNQSFIQFWDGKLTLSKLRKIALSQKWGSNPTVEMLVLSACQTAIGSDQAELGFTGLAVQTGVKTAIGSLWSVSDEGTLGLMSEFYRNLKTAPIRAAALRNAQLSLLSGAVKVNNGQIQFPDGSQVALPPDSSRQNEFNLSHPYYWAAYTVVGNWN
ncbi:CHAT domain-containing protein [Altericista sp. CCNU0014]|uniref:CHAT domain-containing protein n=1 Tax=Altericista sp. CCNU0014 TaxID=3082949 RepID=UPI0038512744